VCQGQCLWDGLTLPDSLRLKKIRIWLFSWLSPSSIEYTAAGISDRGTWKFHIFIYLVRTIYKTAGGSWSDACASSSHDDFYDMLKPIDKFESWFGEIGLRLRENGRKKQFSKDRDPEYHYGRSNSLLKDSISAGEKEDGAGKKRSLKSLKSQGVETQHYFGVVPGIENLYKITKH